MNKMTLSVQKVQGLEKVSSIEFNEWSRQPVPAQLSLEFEQGLPQRYIDKARVLAVWPI